MGPEEDWRLRGQEEVLLGAELVRMPYWAPRKDWEHDHCAFCWAKFMDPAFSPEHKRWIDEHPEVLTEGYATTEVNPQGAPASGSCPGCFDDFQERFRWHVTEPRESDRLEELLGPLTESERRELSAPRVRLGPVDQACASAPGMASPR